MNIELLSEDIIKCDNEKCDYVKPVPFSDYPNWINRPCPKCGENLLTLEDYERAETARSIVAFINSLTTEELQKLGEEMEASGMLNEFLNSDIGKKISEMNKESPSQMVKVSVETHNEIKIICVEKIGNNTNDSSSL